MSADGRPRRQAGRRARRPIASATRGSAAARDGGIRCGATARAIGHHYDVGNDFYRLVLGPSMTYSCARFTKPDATLEDAQAAKHELVCRKLGLHEHAGAAPARRRLRLGLDGHPRGAALRRASRRHHHQQAAGTTWPAHGSSEAGVEDRVEIRLQDYRDAVRRAVRRDLVDRHVRACRPRQVWTQYFTTLRVGARPRGRLLNHAISSVGGSTARRRDRSSADTSSPTAS